MSATLKLHLGSLIYCIILIGLNWYWSINYDREFGVTSESVSPVTLAFLLSGAIMLYLTLRCIILFRARLKEGGWLKGDWVRSWSVVLYALPLLWQRHSTSTWIDLDGALATVNSGYGHEVSSRIFLFAVAGLILFQIYQRLYLNGRPDNSTPA